MSCSARQYCENMVYLYWVIQMFKDIIKLIGMFLAGLLILSIYGINLTYLFFAILIETIPNIIVPILLRYKFKKNYDTRKALNISLINFFVIRLLFGIMSFTILTFDNYNYITATIFSFVLLIVNGQILNGGKLKKNNATDIPEDIKKGEFPSMYGLPKSDIGQMIMGIAIIGIFLLLVISIILTLFN